MTKQTVLLIGKLNFILLR